MEARHFFASDTKNPCQHTGARRGLHLAHDGPKMFLHCVLAEPKLTGDLFIRQPTRDTTHDGLLSIGEVVPICGLIAHLFGF